jgi:DNA-binding CsgD family transcriptional regulator
MSSLTRIEAFRLLEFLDRIKEVDSVSQIERVLLPALCSLMGATMAKYHYIYAVLEPFSVEIGWPSDVFTLSNMTDYARVSHMHPLICSLNTVLARAPDQPLSISDIVPWRDWRGSQVYQEAMKAVGGDDQMAMTLSIAPNSIGAITVTRHGSRFKDRDHLILYCARGHISAATRRAMRTSTLDWPVLQTRPVARWIKLEEVMLRAPSPARTLSPRELEVLAMVSEGFSSGQIARRLDISPRTVSKHLEHVYRKIGVDSRAAATRFMLSPR